MYHCRFIAPSQNSSVRNVTQKPKRIFLFEICFVKRLKSTLIGTFVRHGISVGTLFGSKDIILECEPVYEVTLEN